MNAGEINRFVDKDTLLKAHFRGAVGFDRQPELRTGECAIVNTNNTLDSSVGHWIALYRSGTQLELFDSLNRTKQEIDHDIRNNKRVQHYSATTCGEHCIIFLWFRVRDISMPRIMNIFSDDLHKNDLFVRSMVK